MPNMKRSSYIEEEIDVKPSTELIPDEYEHFDDPQRKVVVHTFTSDNDIDKENSKRFVETIENYGYEIKSTYSLDTDNLDEIFDGIKAECNDDYAGIILFFSGSATNTGRLDTVNIKNNKDIQSIWLSFDSHKCLKLKNKPKIFIFDLNFPAPLIHTDGTRRNRKFQTVYDTPAEADILVVCNKTEGNDDDNDFIHQFCENIKQYAETENIITLASCLGLPLSPLIISTLTRNFYFTPSNLRGHHLTIEKHQQQIKGHIKDIKETVANKFTEKKKKLGFFESFRIGKKSKSDIEPSTPSSSDTISKTNVSSSQPDTQSKRLSGPNAPRTRQMSQSEPDSGRSSMRRLSEKKRPPWRH